MKSGVMVELILFKHELKLTYYTTRCVFSHYKPFCKSASSDITSGRVHLDVRHRDEHAATVHWVGWQTDLSVIHLGRWTRPLVMSEEADFQNGL